MVSIRKFPYIWYAIRFAYFFMGYLPFFTLLFKPSNSLSSFFHIKNITMKSMNDSFSYLFILALFEFGEDIKNKVFYNLLSTIKIIFICSFKSLIIFLFVVHNC